MSQCMLYVYVYSMIIQTKLPHTICLEYTKQHAVFSEKLILFESSVYLKYQMSQSIHCITFVAYVLTKNALWKAWEQISFQPTYILFVISKTVEIC
jgi:hypothetical protein